MIELHPKIIRRRGQKFAVLPFAEFLELQAALAQMPKPPVSSDADFGQPEDNLSAAELARRQGVTPISDLSQLRWPGDPKDWDGFDEAVKEWRRSSQA